MKRAEFEAMIERLAAVHRHEGESDSEFRARCAAAARGEVTERLEEEFGMADAQRELDTYRLDLAPPHAMSREDLTRCRCGRRLSVIYVCVYCRKEEDECKCVDLTEEP